MSLRCSLFGHKPLELHGYFSGMGGGNYLTPVGPIVDGIGRSHFTLYGMCPRCGERYKVGMIHGERLVSLMPTAKEGE